MRLHKFGLKVLVGDLVIRKEQAHLIEAGIEDNVISDAEDEETPEVKPVATNLILDVTEENIHEFSIHEVVMPMVGYQTKMPQNADL